MKRLHNITGELPDACQIALKDVASRTGFVDGERRDERAEGNHGQIDSRSNSGGEMQVV